MRKYWWKIICMVLLIYTVISGFLIPIPDLANNSVLEQTIRNLFFHVPMWFAMIIVLFISLVYSIKYTSKQRIEDDMMAAECANVGILLGILGASTGAVWAKFTWGQFWPNDPKLNGAAIAVMMYFAYGILRNGIEDPQKKAKVSAIYNIFSFPIFIVLILILPKINDSLHPGNGGNPGFNKYDLDSNMRMVFYPAVIGWSLLAWWIVTLNYRIKLISHKKHNNYEQIKTATISTIDSI
jgi:heme exporter protein C